MIEYGISVAAAREGKFQQKAASLLQDALERAKAKGLQDPPLESEVAEQDADLGPIRRGIEVSFDLAEQRSDFEQPVYAFELRSALNAAEKHGFVDKDPESSSTE